MMIALDNLDNYFKEKDFEYTKEAYNFFFENIYKKVNPEVEKDNLQVFKNALTNTKPLFIKYKEIKKKLLINKILKSIMVTANSQGGKKLTPVNDVTLVESVYDMELFRNELIKKGFDCNKLDGFPKKNLDEIRKSLFEAAGLKCKSIIELYENSFDHRNGTRFMDVMEIANEGINPEYFLFPDEEPYIDEEFISNYGILYDYLLYNDDLLYDSNKPKMKK